METKQWEIKYKLQFKQERKCLKKGKIERQEQAIRNSIRKLRMKGGNK